MNALESDYFTLLRPILIDAYRKGALTELKLDGHTSLTGANGVGKRRAEGFNESLDRTQRLSSFRRKLW